MRLLLQHVGSALVAGFTGQDCKSRKWEPHTFSTMLLSVNLSAERRNADELTTHVHAGFTQPEAVTEVDVSRAPPAQGVAGMLQAFQKLFERAQGDPFYAVIAYRSFKPIYE